MRTTGKIKFWKGDKGYLPRASITRTAPVTASAVTAPPILTVRDSLSTAKRRIEGSLRVTFLKNLKRTFPYHFYKSVAAETRYVK